VARVSGGKQASVPSPIDLIKADLIKADPIQIVFASGPAHLNRELIDQVATAEPELPLVIVGEFEPHGGEWIPWHVLRSESANLASVKVAIGSRRVARAAMLLSPAVPFGKMRAVANAIAPGVLTAYDEDLKPVSLAGYRLGRLLAATTSPRARKWIRRVAHPLDAEIPVRARLAMFRGRRARAASPDFSPILSPALPDGVTVVIPSRDGKDLLATLLPGLVPQIGQGEIIVSDNGSTDGTARWLAQAYPAILVIESAKPLSFARAVNAGIRAARFNRVLLLNNDMVVEPGFVDALAAAFDRVPDLFCATAQIFFPAGVRRQETGKAVWRHESPLDFPARCDEPIPGEDLTWVLYGSGGCSLFDSAKLRALGGVSEVYEPAYVEDMDFGFRAWKLGWPSVFCAAAKVEHRHRATTSRFYTTAQLDAFTEINYLRFLVQAIGSPALFQQLWIVAIRRLQLTECLDALRGVPEIGPLPPAATGVLSESEIFALGNGDVAIIPGLRPDRCRRTIIVASPYLPFPLSHGGAVRMYNLMLQAALERDQVLIVFCDELAPPPRELLEICREVILVRRHGSHYRRDTSRPDTVEEFDSETFRACLKQAVHQWKPDLVQLEFTQMAQYAAACSPARTILVEHDITFDLAQQLVDRKAGDRELEQQLKRWRDFETAAWSRVDCVVAMSGKDREAITAKHVACLPNGVDTDRFQPHGLEPERGRLLFIGSFAHLPNVLAIEFFVREVWPLLGSGFSLHIIAGLHPERYPVAVDLSQPGIKLEGFVSDVRNAYSRAEIVLAPLTASAGTNIKVLEAMAMGRLVVSTPAGINGLDLVADSDLIVANTASEIADRIVGVSGSPDERKRFEVRARETALRFDWREIAREQSELYRTLSSPGDAAISRVGL
jgi:GT2 family glycosyltransferase/glycosyltransferase involved in cell wall biosynthesis